MTWKVRLIVLAVVFITAVTVVIWRLSWPHVSSESYARVSEGMPEQDVEGLLGHGKPCPFANDTWPDRKGTAKCYIGKEFSVIVWYDDSGRVLSKTDYLYLDTDLKAGEPLFARVLRWLRLTR
jgi:hypothetical protein